VQSIAPLPSSESLVFPEDFVWGVSTCAYQIEGALNVDGREPSVWDSFCREPGHVKDGTTAEVACDHYHRCPEDLMLLRELGARAHRFSIAWPRVQPDGRGPPNPKGSIFMIGRSTSCCGSASSPGCVCITGISRREAKIVAVGGGQFGPGLTHCGPLARRGVMLPGSSDAVTLPLVQPETGR
jgi:Glycosyl hydrolase family 1